MPVKVSRRIGANTRATLSLCSKASIACFQSIGSVAPLDWSLAVTIGSGGSIAFSIPSSAAPRIAASTRYGFASAPATRCSTRRAALAPPGIRTAAARVS